ncbi:MAG: phosphoribosylamine--glycine ligase [bacterium]|nr:phosphoribosylamine--glycine ligase [bacterium]
MKILVIGSNGREHALATKYSESKKADVVFIAPGNGLTDYKTEKIINVQIAMTDLDALIKFSKKEKIDLVDIAQDDCLAKGYVDRFQKENIAVFGPTKMASEIEWSKDWARKFMLKYHLPIPEFQVFSNAKIAINSIKKKGNSILFIKASGLALGKGVIKAENFREAREAILQMKSFGLSGKTFLIEEGLIGEEFSLFVICDGKNYVISQAAQDHKTIYNNNVGLNTGGIGSVAPTNAITNTLLKKIEKIIIKPFLLGMEKENRTYSGILYVGGILTKRGIKIIEFNARWGDPEAEVILPGITSDYVDIARSVINQKLNTIKVIFDNKIRVAVTACANGYPTDYSSVKGKEIFGIQDIIALPHIKIFGSGIKRVETKFFVNGGRVLHVVGSGKNIKEARQRTYDALSLLYIQGNNLHYRTDIGFRDLERTL